ncbi:RNA polymerase sigma factor [Spirosoma panaciterrae]|uniref:RNA polymerase sigma factor n=1 Tax=Spirosoma panaciterrae TaxID=496058 RepID=UPI0003692273|nr:sigma-70 family RNA polymerase sigma factor [Spirosoma panaciterrae]
MADQDKVLWANFRQGDDKAFEELLHANYKSLLEYGIRFIKDREATQDFVHDLFVNLWERRVFLNPDIDNIKLYLFATLRNQIFKSWHKNTHLDGLPDDWQGQEPESDNLIETKLIEQENTLENEFRLQQVVSRLSKRQQEMLHLKYFEGLSHEQIAELMNISQPAVRNLLSQSLKSFREQWRILLLVLYVFIANWLAN